MKIRLLIGTMTIIFFVYFPDHLVSPPQEPNAEIAKSEETESSGICVSSIATNCHTYRLHEAENHNVANWRKARKSRQKLANCSIINPGYSKVNRGVWAMPRVAA